METTVNKCPSVLPETSHMIAMTCMLPAGHSSEHRSSQGVLWQGVVKHKDKDPRNNAIDNLELEVQSKADESKNFSVKTGNGRIYRGDGSPLVPGPLVPVTVPYVLVRRQVAKVWKLYDHWQASVDKAERGEENLRRNVETDYGLYMHYRGLVEAAIAGGPPAWKDEFILP